MGGLLEPVSLAPAFLTLQEKMFRVNFFLSSWALFMLPGHPVRSAPSPCSDLQDLGFALSFGNRTPCKRSIYLGANRLERLEPEYNPTFWKLVNMLESIEQSNLGKRGSEEKEVEEKKPIKNRRSPFQNSFGRPFFFYEENRH